jgi:hypothetical protein
VCVYFSSFPHTFEVANGSVCKKVRVGRENTKCHTRYTYTKNDLLFILNSNLIGCFFKVITVNQVGNVNKATKIE